MSAPPAPAKEVIKYRVAAVPASQRGRRWLYIFWGVCLTLLSGLALFIFPLVQVTIIPELESVTVTPTLRIDLDLTNPLPEAGVIPGRQLDINGSQDKSEDFDSRSIRVGDKLIIFSKNQADQALAYALNKGINSEYQMLAESLTTVSGQAQKLPSGRSFSLPFTISVQIYRRFPVTEWLGYLPGLNLAEAEAKLVQYRGVKQARVELYPSFFARLTNKLPSSPSAYRFTLDINGKTSILKKRSN
ncbi:MAG: hypothetical protein HY974_03145 [Candidatus Kerfeldbacteria bacterium]|nr:hypothetical protein [Candidatus Kerfeldbacteria bacterium]